MNGVVEVANKNIKRIIHTGMIGFLMLSTHIKNSKNINWCYTLFAGILNGGDYSPGSGNLIVKSIDGAQSRRS
jgi:hypothetical protein